MASIPETVAKPETSEGKSVVKSGTGQSHRSGVWKPARMPSDTPGGMASLANELAVEPTLRRNFDFENEAGGEIKPHIDPSLLFGMERTLFSALNLGVMGTFFGFGLMMVSLQNEEEKKAFFAQGCAIVSFCLLYMVSCWLTHAYRMQMLRRGQPVGHGSSIVWTASLMCLMCLCIFLELYYSGKFPYMERSMPVDVAED